jgi:hypothetical protein
MVQAVATFVKQGDDIVVGEQGRLTIDAFAEVADQVGNGGLQLRGVGSQPTRTHIVHPCAAAFAASGAGVKVELAK